MIRLSQIAAVSPPRDFLKKLASETRKQPKQTFLSLKEAQVPHKEAQVSHRGTTASK